jgi:putative transposase
MIEQPNPLSLTRQCQLLGLSRTALYYRPVEVSGYELELMALIDRQYLRTPFYGSRRMTAWLQTQGQMVNRKRVRRLMRLIGIEAIISAHAPAGRQLNIVSILTCCAVWPSNGSIRQLRLMAKTFGPRVRVPAAPGRPFRRKRATRNGVGLWCEYRGNTDQADNGYRPTTHR